MFTVPLQAARRAADQRNFACERACRHAGARYPAITLFPLFPPDALERMKKSGIFALAEPGKLD
jgi:hypothetical protein